VSEVLFQQLREAALAGALPEAARGLERLDATWPKADVAALRAWIALCQGDLDGARTWLERTFAREPDHREALTLALDLALRRGDVATAVDLAERLLAREPRSALAHHNRAVALRAAGRPGADAAWAEALALDPRQPVVRAARAWARFDDGDAVGAREDFTALAALAPRDLDAWIGLGACALRVLDAAGALRAFDRACTLAPSDASAWRGRADALELLGRVDASLQARSRAVALAGEASEALEDLAMARSRAGDPDLARATAARARTPLGDWLAFQCLPIVHRDEAGVAASLALWRDGLERFARRAADCTPAEASAVLTTMTSFHRHYVGDPLVDDQRRVATVLETLGRRVLPEPPVRIRVRADGRLRVGFATAHWGAHTVAELFAAFPAGLDRRRFTVVAIHLGRDLAQVDGLARLADEVLGPRFGLASWWTALVGADLDALVWLDIGMDGTTQALATRRWARRQYVLWGHPVTTGLSTIDGFVSAAGMEPDDGPRQYTETLHVLPGVGLSAPLPPMAPVEPEPGLLVCAQGVHKLLPHHDPLFARILRDAPGARLELLPGALPPQRAALESRLHGCLAAHGVDPSRLRVRERLEAGEFAARVARAELVLDSVGWSGGRTTLQALAAGRPVLTLPGANLRSRHARAMLDALALADALVAGDADDFVARAVELACDPRRCAALSGRVRERRAALDADPAPLRALESLIERECRA
jgi:predicted O-linked N-acetylglucosamine transferase (SPINDLY family)